MARLAERLAAAANPDGGWPYYAGRASRLEPTCWALLALTADPAAPPVTLAAHLEFLRSTQGAAGLLADPGTGVPNLAWSGLALLALPALEAPDATVDRLGAGVVAAKGVALDPDVLLGQDNRLQAWSWMPGTFSWIEPTALCVLALKRLPEGRRPGAAGTRIADGEAVLLDRVCPSGGWNYGNASVLGQDLRAYVPTTALALLALQDRASEPAVGLSLSWLDRHALAERSAMALALAALALAVHRRPFGHVLAALDAEDARTHFLDNAHLLAMAAYAAAIPAHDAAAFRVAGPGASPVRGGAA
ncbi:MAG: hypothetical protein R2752_18250 [Vicinamibacterales bacterium]